MPKHKVNKNKIKVFSKFVVTSKNGDKIRDDILKILYDFIEENEAMFIFDKNKEYTLFEIFMIVMFNDREKLQEMASSLNSGNLNCKVVKYCDLVRNFGKNQIMNGPKDKLSGEVEIVVSKRVGDKAVQKPKSV